MAAGGSSATRPDNVAAAANQRIWDFVHQPANVRLRPATGYYSTPFRGGLFGEVKAAEVAKRLPTQGVDLLWLGANPCVPRSLRGALQVRTAFVRHPSALRLSIESKKRLVAKLTGVLQTFQREAG